MKKLTIILIALCLVGTVIGGELLARQNSVINIEKNYSDAIKEKTNINMIAPEVSNIICDSKWCWAKVYQKDVINDKFRVKRYYCLEYGAADEWDDSLCLKFINYTEEEIIIMRNEFVKNRLIEYGDALMNRKAKESAEETIGGGTIIINSK